MFKKLFLMLHLLQVVFGAPIRNNLPLDNGHVMTVKRQAGDMDWTVTDFSGCSATCGGGLRIRSVRCLNNDGVISEDCSIESKPKSYEFCNQIDCNTNNSDNTLLPQSATYTFLGNFDAMLQFDNQGPDSYAITLNITESDSTMTSINERVGPNGTQTRITISGANDVVGIGQLPNSNISLLVNGEDLLNLDSPVKITVRDTQSVKYQDNQVSIVSGDSLIEDVVTLFYNDGLRFYRFDKDIVESLEGPGSLYYNPGRGTAVYITTRALSNKLDEVIASLLTTTDFFNPEVPIMSSSSESPPFTTTESDASMPPTQTPKTDDPISIITDQPIDEETVVTDEPDIDMCDEEESEESKKITTEDSTSSRSRHTHSTSSDHTHHHHPHHSHRHRHSHPHHSHSDDHHHHHHHHHHSHSDGGMKDDLGSKTE